MAEALISMVVEQFISYVNEEVALVVGVREEVGKLRRTLEMIQGLLQDAEQKQVKNNAVKVWLRELRDILYESDDVMDKWNTEMALSRLRSGVHQADTGVNRHSARKVLSYLLCSCFKHVTVRYDISHQIKAIGERLDQINSNRNQFGLVVSPSQDQPRRTTSSIIDISIHGRDNDTKIIVSKLLSESSHQKTNVQVVAIVGMGGFGKTTLAKLVLKEERVVRTFKEKMWVCVSEPFNLSGVAKAIIEQAHGEVPSSTEWDSMHQGLSKAVEGKHFLLVLDDVWTKDPNHWNPLKVSLDGGAPGSRIIVTTRNEEVAKMMGSSHIHNVEKLSEGDSWSLVRDIALKGRGDEYKKFEKVGKEIATKCKGVPLALCTLAALLRVKTTVQNWRDISESDLWGLADVEIFFLPSLFLSYYALPSVSKQCFLYCAIFPKDTEMPKDLLVKLWMAEGFLGSEAAGELEKIGEDHFNNLAMQSFFQDFEKDWDGNITSCKMHDLVHDFAQYLSQGECSDSAKFDCDKVRYLYLNRSENPSLYEARKVRSVLKPRNLSVELFSKLPCLRVLDLQDADLKELPDAVEKLVHLRYLDLSDNRKLKELPETICNLYNLQTLRLNRCIKLKKLPEEIGRLSNLRYLEMERTNDLLCLPQSVKRLRSLRTLSKFIVSEGCKIGDLKHLKNLRGSLELIGLGRITEESEAVEADLKKKKDLRGLTYNWGNGVENDVAAGAVGMLERLEPHEDLEILKIRNYPGSQLPRWFHNRLLLGIIVKLKFYKCPQITQLPALGKLASLESLKIENMTSVKSIGREFYYGFDSNSLGDEMIAFSKLKTLKLKCMDGLEKWELPIISKDTKIMPLLSKLKIESCRDLKALPACLGKLESLEELDIEGLDSIERLDLNLVMSKSMPQEEQVIIFRNMMMPCLSELRIAYCRRLRVLPDLTKFKSLVRLVLDDLDSWEGETEKEEENVRNEKERVHSMPSSFTMLFIGGCPKLIQVPTHLFSPWLKQLYIENCPELSGLQYLPPLLETLTLIGDCGGYSKSIPLQNNEECSITHFSLNEYPHSSLPDGFKNLKALRTLFLYKCESLDFELKELQHFTLLQHLEIYECPLLKERFNGDGWRSILPHVPKIRINYKEIH